MYLHLEKIRYKNFLSTGEMWVEIQLDRSTITAVVGDNGGGKSSFLDAMVFASYGKPLRKINKPQIVNVRNNGGTLVEFYFKVDDKPYMVRRGIKPDIFEIYENGILIPQTASTRDYQQHLESNILRMNFVTFTQSIIISKATYKPFMQLDSGKRREYIEDILGLSIFGIMAKLHSKKFKPLNDELNAVSSECAVLKERVVNVKKHISNLTKIVEQNSDEKASSMMNEISVKNGEIKDLQTKIYKLELTLKDFDREKYNTVSDRFNKINNLKIKLEVKEKSLTNKLAKLERNTVCDSCNQPLNPEHIAEHREKYTSELNAVKIGIDDLSNRYNVSKKEIDELDEVQKFNTSVKNEVDRHKYAIDTLNRDIKRINEDMSNLKVDYTEIDQAKAELDKHISEFKSKYELKAQLDNDIEYHQLVGSFLKDSGIKSTIIERAVPIINTLINQNLAKFGFFVNFSLDKDFNETIKSRGVDKLSYYNFSEGEKLRIDLAILLAWREVASLQASVKCNCLFMDEITDASMDVDGAEILGNMLTEMKDTNIFIITHSPEKLESSIRSYIKFERVDGYSKIVNYAKTA
ncbi:MAG: hypothetical protein RSC93_02095 [Erysipelotrichaceae bacterium]